jgi:hypothetical protein
MARELFVRQLGPGMQDVTGYDSGLLAIRADRTAVVEWCERKAEGAAREAAAQESGLPGHGIGAAWAEKWGRVNRCEGQASAFRAVAAILRGGT